MPDPERIHLHVGRGNQLRVTVALSNEVLEAYARDLLARDRTFRSLIDAGELRITQNAAFDAMAATQERVGLEGLVAAEKGLDPQALRDRNLTLMERLNPGRVFRIRMPLTEVVSRWLERVEGIDPARLDAQRQVDLLDAMLPARLFLEPSSLDAETSAELKALLAAAARYDATSRAQAAAALRPAFVRLLDRVGRGRYPARGEALEFAEFTAIYPVGTANEFMPYRGRQIPLYPTPGRRQLTTHQRSNTSDHIAEVPTYSFSPWLPYMHVGPKMHNAFHTPYWELRLSTASWLPERLRTAIVRGREGTRLPNAYLLSRGPASHGCTHVNPGHLVELRQILPAQTEGLEQVQVFLTRSEHFDVFDIDGDLEPEVMGVRYFVAYSIHDDRPGKMRAPVERAPFYDWLYAGELRLGPDGRGTFENVRDAKFVGNRATEGTLYPRLALYEAAYEPERVQFYATRPISFVRELRKVGADHPFSPERARSRSAL
ncbi:MAG: hypothetical protein IT386_04290 [Deltaproteobacteria bacterium]|nr:hypothetical protein [Deltaproteobacteria bacterium]